MIAHRPDHDRQPARPARVREHLRRPDLPVRLPRPAHGRSRDVPGGIGPGRRHRPDRTRSRPAPTRSASSCCSRRSPSGSVALTGTEAIANGVPAFQPPEAKNAANTMIGMAVLLAVLFIGITFISDGYGILPTEEGGPTVVALVAATVFGEGTRAVRPVPGRDRADPVPRGEHQRSTRSRAWEPCSRSTATCRASSRSGATASRTPTGSSCWLRSPRA